MNGLTRALRGAARSAGRADLLSLYAGQGVGRLRRGLGAGAIVDALVAEMAAARAAL
jgi:nitronate monooxygenase